MGSVPDEERVAGAQTIARALAVLSLLRRARADVGVTQIGRRLGLRSSTAHRILRALVVAGYVSQNPDNDRYRLGRESLLLGLGAEHTLGFAAATPLLEQLRQQSGESASLVVRDGDCGLVVLRVDSSQPLRFSQPAGSRIPLHCTSSGKVLLAFGGDPKAEVDRLDALARLTDHTVTARRTLLCQLRRVQEQGFAINEGERNPGVSGVAAPVLEGTGTVLAALAIQGPSVRLARSRLQALGPQLIQLARQVAVVLPAAGRLQPEGPRQIPATPVQ